MTTPAIGSGRPSAIHRPASCRTLPGSLKLLCIGALALAALPVSARQNAIEPRDPLEAPSFNAPVADAEQVLPVGHLAYAKDLRALLDTYTVAGVPETLEPAKREGRIRKMLNRALTLLGTPYRWGGNSPESGFDCSGLVGYVFRTTLGVELPRISRDMANVGELIRDPKHLVEGDLVFFSRRGKNVDHVGIYLGDGRFVHAPRKGKNVEISTLSAGYWSQKFLKARRIENI